MLRQRHCEAELKAEGEAALDTAAGAGGVTTGVFSGRKSFNAKDAKESGTQRKERKAEVRQRKVVHFGSVTERLMRMGGTERGVTVREARPEDVPGMMELARRSETASQWGEEVYARLFDGGNGSRVALCIEQGGELSGFVVAGHVGPEWEIENVVVATDKKRQGIGSRLLEALLRRAKSEGAESIFLEVRESNEAARAMYRKWGFEEVGRRRGYYSAPAEDGVVYRKCL